MSPTGGDVNKYAATAPGADAAGGWSRGASHRLAATLATIPKYDATPAQPTTTTTAPTPPASTAIATRATQIDNHADATRASFPLLGGNISDCLSDNDLDMILGAFLPATRRLYARMIHDIGHDHLDPDAAVVLIEQALRASAPDLAAQWVVTAMHVRHHWALALFARCPHTGQTEMVVYDSAPSPITRKDMLKIARKLDLPIRFVCPARQLPMSNECGLFLVLFALLVQHDVERMRAWPNTAHPPVVSLAPWRALLAAVDCDGRPAVRTDLSAALLPRLISAVSLPPALVPVSRRRNDPYRPVRTTRRRPCLS